MQALVSGVVSRSLDTCLSLPFASTFTRMGFFECEYFSSEIIHEGLHCKPFDVDPISTCHYPLMFYALCYKDGLLADATTIIHGDPDGQIG